MEVRSRRFFGHEVFGKLHVPAGIVFDEGPFEGWFPITRTGKNRGGDLYPHPLHPLS
ncbi:hypothetical protein DSO57_1008797 [Entomophthora muscae]|uniref:Uncharacterized protein n=1 Tax=Entomophthora muscae TaxID=34485 RepID=A0ACC2USL3_9FUNG|nr:hypothetical protein DSO57_1008797 [Entomophthora muscae]